jgi:hypothetical protein
MNFQGLEINERLLWDANLEEVDAYKNASTIVSRVLSRGDLADIRAVLNFYNVNQIIEACKASVTIGKREVNFIAAYFDIDIKELECSERKLLKPNYLEGYSS